MHFQLSLGSAENDADREIDFSDVKSFVLLLTSKILL